MTDLISNRVTLRSTLRHLGMVQTEPRRAAPDGSYSETWSGHEGEFVTLTWPATSPEQLAMVAKALG